MAYNQDVDPASIQRVQQQAKDRLAPPGLLGRLFTERTSSEFAEWTFLPWSQPPNVPPCPLPESNPCGKWAKLLARPLQAVLGWKTPDLPDVPRLAARKPPKPARPRRTRAEFIAAALGLTDKERCARLLSEFRFLDARAGCPPGATFTIIFDFFITPTALRAPTANQGLSIEGIIVTINDILAHPPSAVLSIRAE